MTTTVTSAELIDEFWAAEFACTAANMKIWASGRDPGEDDPEIGPLVTEAVDLNDRLLAMGAELTTRGGDASYWWLYELVDALDQTSDPAIADQIRAAAFLRVITSDVYLDDAEALQPGGEIPAVGIWALDD
ncbi:hypothetical protein [Frankia sp. Cj3]|uniref:hypothetical protein n=1 Tax=Frankia sp. Cj3 TaxID=2880976 RepID=UPI001EF721C7|nr:hypothetical protein [Frankia sp. Cj3]